MLIDAGANTNCKKENFLQFAEMGKIYLEKTGKKTNPKIGLLNIGTEETKGSEIHKEAYMYLKENYEEKGLNFIGNIEARDPFTGDVDLVVSDGFTGNIFIYPRFSKVKVDDSWLQAQITDEHGTYEVVSYQVNYFNGKVFSYEVNVI